MKRLRLISQVIIIIMSAGIIAGHFIPPIQVFTYSWIGLVLTLIAVALIVIDIAARFRKK